MRAAIIQNGKVVNIVEADEAFAAEQGWVLTDTAQIGWSYDGQTFTPPAGPSIEDQRAQMTTTRAKFAIAAHGAGIITAAEAEAWAGGNSLPSAVDGLITSLPDRIDALTATTVRRTAPLITALQADLSLTDAQVDALFA